MLGHAAAVLRSAAHYTFPRTSMRLIGLRHRHDEIELGLLPALVDADREAIDVGANVGRYAIPLAGLARHVHVFEPHPRLARMLRRALPRNASVREVAVSDTFGKTTLQIPIADGREDEGLAHLDQRPDDARCRSVEVLTATLDSLGAKDIGFIKIDVEGHEMRVLLGARALLSRCQPIVLVEAEDRHNPGGVGRVAAFFEERGYDGVFVHQRTVHPIGAFDTAMQDPTIFCRMPPTTPRRDVPYVNNFLFIPRTREAGDIVEQIRWILRHEVERASFGAIGLSGGTT